MASRNARHRKPRPRKPAPSRRGNIVKRYEDGHYIRSATVRGDRVKFLHATKGWRERSMAIGRNLTVSLMRRLDLMDIRASVNSTPIITVEK